MEIVFHRLQKAGLKMGGKKTHIGLREIKYLGHICSRDGVRMDPTKIETIQNWPRPQTTGQLREFLGLCGYHRRFIENYSRIAHPLTQQQSSPPRTRVRWTSEAISAFEILKSALADPTQVLAYPDFSPHAEPFIIKTDACRVSEGAILLQKQNDVERIIAYASRAFPKSEQAWGITQLEAHAIFWAITKPFNFYVRSTDKPFYVRTDHRPCLAMKVSKVASERMYRWALALQEYKMEMFHVSGRKHSDCDAISRLGYIKDLHEKNFLSEDPISLHTIFTEDSEPSFSHGPLPHSDSNPESEDTFTTKFPKQDILEVNISAIYSHLNFHATANACNIEPEVEINALAGAGYQPDAIREAQKQDASTSSLWYFLKERRRPELGDRSRIRKLSKDCYLDDDIIYHRGGIYGKQLLVPQCLRQELLVSMHDAQWSGHFGQHHTLQRISRNYWWPAMSTDVIKYIRSCMKCQNRNFPPNMRRRDPIIGDEIPKLFERIAIDVQGPFKTSKKGNKFILTFLDVHSRWIEAFCLPEINEKIVADLLVNQIILRYGPVREILSDRAFLGNVIKEVCKIFRIGQIQIAAYHPQSNATLERVHRVYNDSLSKYVNTNQDDWDEYFPFIQWAYRSAIQTTTGESPYTLVYGRTPQALADFSLLPPPPAHLKEDVAMWRDLLVKRISRQQNDTAHMQRRAQERLLKGSQKNVPLRTFKVDDLVMIRNHARVRDRTTTLTHKWLPRFLGPYKVISQKGTTTYEVQHCASPRDRRTYSVDDIKPYFPHTVNPPSIDLSQLPITGDSHGWNVWREKDADFDEREVEKILQRSEHARGGRHRNEYRYLLRWKHFGPEFDE